MTIHRQFSIRTLSTLAIAAPLLAGILFSNEAGAGATVATSTVKSTAAQTATLNQTQAQSVSGEIASSAADNRATAAIVLCAEGAIKAVAWDEGAKTDISNCQNKMAEANQLAQMAAQTGKDGVLRPDPSVLAEEQAQATLSKFEKNFGISKEAYLNRMLRARGNFSVFGEILGEKLGSEHTNELLADTAKAVLTPIPVVSK